jgi:hypothetical protein
MGAWIASKSAANWYRRANTDENRTGTLTALIGNALSFGIAVVCGVAANGDALRIWYEAGKAVAGK